MGPRPSKKATDDFWAEKMVRYLERARYMSRTLVLVVNKGHPGAVPVISP